MHSRLEFAAETILGIVLRCESPNGLGRRSLMRALKFLWTHPFRELTVGEVMSISGASRSAFYQYFADLHELMETLLQGIEDDIFAVAMAWFEGEGDPVALLEETMAGLVRVCYRQGPILRAVADAAPMDERLEKAWTNVLKNFDDAITDRIEQQQAAGLIKPFEARPVAMALEPHGCVFADSPLWTTPSREPENGSGGTPSSLDIHAVRRPGVGRF